MSLTPEQQRQRDGKLTASAVGCLMSGDAGKIMDLWRELTGDPDYQRPDLSNVWPVQLGVATEAVNLRFYALATGHTLARHGEVVTCPAFAWAACTLDAWDEGMPGPVDAKHVGGFEPIETIRDRYFPQMTWQMLCTGATQSALSVVEGARPPRIVEIAWDVEYAAELVRRAEAFMRCVWDLAPPIALPPIEPPIDPVMVYDMATSNEWGDLAATWLETQSAAKKFSASEKSIKAIVPADAARCHGHGIEVKRNKAGSLSIRAA